MEVTHIHYPYLIIGGGMTAAAAVAGIHRRDKDSRIGLFSADRYPPYNRPPLSKKLWLDDRLEDIWCRPALDQWGVDEHLATPVVELDPTAHTIRDAYGTVTGFDTLLLATGGIPRRLPQDVHHDLIYFRSLDDYLKVYHAAKPGTQAIIIGGGFIGSELAAVLSLREVAVTVVFPESHLLAAKFPRDLTKYLEQVYHQHGVTLVAERTVTGVTRSGGAVTVSLSDGTALTAPLVIAGLGLEPNTTLAEAAGLAVDNGIIVDPHLETSAAGIFAAGDVASFALPFVDHRLRVEHEDNALVQGRLAGENMAGAAKSYGHLPFFYSDLYTMGYEAIGTIDSQLDVFADWTTFGQEGVLYYLHNRQVVGVVNWNVWDRIPQARQLIADRTTVAQAKDLKGRIRPD